jgi:hypothetical protein
MLTFSALITKRSTLVSNTDYNKLCHSAHLYYNTQCYSAHMDYKNNAILLVGITVNNTSFVL